LRYRYHGGCTTKSTCEANNIAGDEGIQTMIEKASTNECVCIDEALVMRSDTNVVVCIQKPTADDKCLLYVVGQIPEIDPDTCLLCDEGYKVDGTFTGCEKEDVSSLAGCELGFLFNDMGVTTLMCSKCFNTHAMNTIEQTCIPCASPCTNCEYVPKIAAGAVNNSTDCEYEALCNTDDQCVPETESDICRYFDEDC
jgi:hypothetical protein